jgi:plastocyanin/heme-degrading monooxygenase HmoA
MEYVQTVLASIAATKFEAATGHGSLLAELDAHRGYLETQPGFRGIQITRSANPEGDVLLVVVTRWANNNAMADYSTHEPTVASIVNKFGDLLVPNSVQVHRMEADKTPARDAPNQVYDRLALAVLIPAGVLALAVLVIFGLSRIYLVLPGSWATPLAAGAALSVLGIAWYFATHPHVPRWQIGGLVVVLFALGVTGIAASIYDDQHAEKKKPAVAAKPTSAAATPAAGTTPAAAGTTPAAAGAPVINMGDNYFADADANTSPTITVNSGTDITINNQGTALHNVHVAKSGSYAVAVCKTGGDDPCSKPAQVAGGATAIITINLPAGTYNFRCDFHPDQMTGKLVVQ